MPSHHGSTADDWPEDRLAHDEPSSSGHRHSKRRAHYHEKGLNTGVRIMGACHDNPVLCDNS